MSGKPSFELANELMSDYADCLDTDRLEEWLDLFAEDCTYRAVPRENFDRGLPAALISCSNKNMLRDRIVSLREANEFNPHYDRHIIGNIRIKSLESDAWRLDASYAVFQTTNEGRSSLFSVGRYIDDVFYKGDRLIIRHKLVVVDTFAVPSLLATPL
jgi:anthranilate 1,2-dioxygenase small subunit